MARTQASAASFSLAFGETSPASLTALSQRILDYAPLTGIGAGTFAGIAPIYRDANDLLAGPTAPTAAATFAIELGRPMLWLIVAAIGGATFVLLRASLWRGRDSFHPAAGGGSLLTLLFLGFVNAGLLNMATGMLAAATVGLGFAQSKSRTIQQ
jgi:hypothetical protein